jgi:transcriptional regulator with XRE-family HTH domain
VSDQDFGGLIRRQRDQLGLSVNRVAELVGRAPGTVKNWERGRSVPSDPGLLSTIAAVLAIPESELFEAAGLDAPLWEHAPTIEQSLSEIAPPAGRAPTDEDAEEPHLPGFDDAPEPVSVPETRRGRARHVRAPVESEDRPVPVITIPPPSQPQPSRSYVEDPNQRMLYRLRWAFTAAGLFVTFVILAWAGGHLLSALGEFWDALFGGL